MVASRHKDFEDRHGPDSVTADSRHQLAYLETALWKHLAEASTAGAFARAWLTLQCTMLVGVTRGLVILDGRDADSRRTVARWPANDEAGMLELVQAAETARSKRRGIVRTSEMASADGASPPLHVGYPIIIDDEVRGMVALQVTARAESDLGEVMRQLQWGSAWLEVLQRRGSPRVASAPRQRLVTVLQQVATCIEQPGFRAAASAVATELATEMNCERVSIGFLRGKHARLDALSHSADFGKKSNLVRTIGAAMDEAIDQGEAITYPGGQTGSVQVTRAHAALQDALQSRSVCTVPFGDGGKIVGAFTFEHAADSAFDSDAIQLFQHLASIIGPILNLQRREDRWLGKKILISVRRQLERLTGARYTGRKLATVLSLALLLFFAVAQSEYRVAADASLEGSIQRVVSAPMNGYIGEVRARAGDIVAAGDVLVALDDTDLQLEKLKWTSQKTQLERQRRDALAQHKRAQTRIFKAQWSQANAELELLDEQLARTRIKAPFDGIVVSGDLSQALGAPVERGEVLMEVAPLDQYRVVLAVDEREISYLSTDQHGELILPSIPGESFPFVVDKITPVSTAEEGKNTFRVEATLLKQSNALRPGMEGAGKITVGERKLIWIWTHKFTEWLTLWTWRWWY